MTSRAGQPGWLDALGNYAGAASRFAAYAVDVIVSWGAFTLGLAGVTFAIRIITGHSVSWHLGGSIAVGVVFAVWELTYFGYCWAAAGRTPGMALFGLRVVRADGADLDPWRGVLRALFFPLSVLVCGLGFAGILVQREHRALHDLLAGSAVIYSWDARATRLRFLARTASRPRLD
ncbi:MAG TPA: RDD family protein [Trebonia sp.]|nr:RDD family protein [Trebonia sp.]